MCRRAGQNFSFPVCRQWGFRWARYIFFYMSGANMPGAFLRRVRARDIFWEYLCSFQRVDVRRGMRAM